MDRVHEHKHLGIYLSSSLSWARQIHETSLKASRKLAVLRSIKYLKRSTLDLLYKVCVRSVIEYGLVLYWHTLKPTEAARLNQIQYRASKLVTGALHFTSQTRLEADLSWETIADRAKLLGICIFHKIHLLQTRPLIRRCLPELNNNITRQAGTYKPIKYYGLKYKNSFFPIFSVFWSKLKPSIRSETDMDVFKSLLKDTFKPKRHKHFSYGDKLSNSLLCRLRVGRSMLKSHGFAINLSSTDRCYCGAVDDTKHFLLSCFIWQEERSDLIQKVKQVLPSFSQKSIRDQCEILTFGINLNSPRPDPRNRTIMLAVQKFITKINRFSKHYD